MLQFTVNVCASIACTAHIYMIFVVVAVVAWLLLVWRPLVQMAREDFRVLGLRNHGGFLCNNNADKEDLSEV